MQYATTTSTASLLTLACCVSLLQMVCMLHLSLHVATAAALMTG
jgi:hypothetical protein